jgi:hypothetical protein
MKVSTRIAMGLVALITLAAPATAQGPARDPAPEEQRLNAMMTMMRGMQADMQQMREHMAAMHGTGAMPSGMEQMKTMMGRMQSMMEQHREQMPQCPALAPAPGGGKSGG